MLFLKRDSRGIQNPISELPTPRGTSVMATPVSVFNGKSMRGSTKNRDFPRFLALFQFWCIFEGGTQRHPKTHGDLPTRCGTWDMAAWSFNFIGKHEGGPNKNRNFLNFRFSDPLKAQNSPQRGPCTHGHLIGPFLSSGFTSGLRPLPTCYLSSTHYAYFIRISCLWVYTVKTAPSLKWKHE